MLKKRLKTYFRVDASGNIGTGHISRCIALALALKRQGRDVTFISGKQTDISQEMVSAAGFPVIPIAVNSEGFGEYPWEADADATRNVLEEPDWLIVDCYNLDARWHEAVRRPGLRILVIDDLANRTYNCDLLVDSGRARDNLRVYDSYVPKFCQIYGGPQHAILREEFSQKLRASAPKGKFDLPKLLVFFGSADRHKLTCAVLDALQIDHLRGRLETDIVITTANADAHKIVRQAQACENIKVHRNVIDMIGLLADTDFSIGAGGVSLWERCAMSVPGLVVAVNDNQVPGVEIARKAGAVRRLTLDEVRSPDTLSAHLNELVEDVELVRRMASAGGSLVDGHGARRLAALMGNLSVRQAVENDCDFLWRLANDPIVREMSFNQKSIRLDSHKMWFRRKMELRNTLLLIAENHNSPVGQVRFDGDDNGEFFLIDISIATNYRNRGYGIEILLKGLAEMERRVPNLTAVAWVKTTNVASVKLFSTAGFVRSGQKSNAIRMTWKPYR